MDYRISFVVVKIILILLYIFVWLGFWKNVESFFSEEEDRED